MRLNKNLGVILLGVWLIATGLFPLLNIRFTGSGVLMAALAIAAGVLILVGTRGRKLPRNLGTLLLSIWLIVTGLFPLLNIRFANSGLLLALLAIAAGVLILVGS
jgi:hypothetical protein